MARPQSELSAVRRRAVDISWARTPDRAERTQPATNASPVSLAHWVKKVREEGLVKSEADILKAAKNYHRAYMTQLSLKASAARRTKAAKAAGR
ncbi:hypothetical protein GCM10009555_018360 [Acrocarpospora macrocephala]|uniref:Uncharacterized protein n=1 Tax=Acrocarpospora macrocephala TaxID=150177 RepID=A0A5M3WFB1_9ACTN|nr:hypothetical protein [Acrocarpospora macrocephala]GES07496.1 hypothetical protein Amac_010910 [Acrocarpospora macrocephala]